MTTYKDSGVDIAEGDAASAKAYQHAVSTFQCRNGCVGEPVEDAGGFTGLLDMGDFFLTQNTDGVGTKIELALQMEKLDTLGTDLLAMVADDAVTVGAEVISVTNTIDVPHVNQRMIDQLLKGFADACRQQRITIVGGEIAEVPDLVKTPVWNATAVGIVEKGKVLRPETIRPGDRVVALREKGARSNGFTLIRNVVSLLKSDTLRLKQQLLTPSTIYHDAVLHLLGRFKEERKLNVKGIAHVTGGGIAGNLARILKKAGVGAVLTDLWEPPPFFPNLIDPGSVPLGEAYRTWNMGNGMLLVLANEDSDQACKLLVKEGIEAKVAGEIQKEKQIALTACDGTNIVTPI